MTGSVTIIGLPVDFSLQIQCLFSNCFTKTLYSSVNTIAILKIFKLITRTRGKLKIGLLANNFTRPLKSIKKNYLKIYNETKYSQRKKNEDTNTTC